MKFWVVILYLLFLNLLAFGQDKAAIDLKCQSFIQENNLINFRDDICANDISRCLYNKHNKYDRSLREYDHQSILTKYDQMVHFLNKDPNTRKWFERTDGKSPTYLDCKNAKQWTECKAYNAYCMSKVLKVSLDEDIKKYADHVNFCSNSKLVKKRYIENSNYSHLTFKERKEKALKKCRGHYKKLKTLQGYIPHRRNKIDSQKLPHTKSFFEKALTDLDNIKSLEQMEKAIESIEIDQENMATQLRVQGILERCRKENAQGDVYGRNIESQITNHANACRANHYFSQNEIGVLKNDWDKIKNHLADKDFDEMNKKISYQVLPDMFIASWKYELCRNKASMFSKEEAMKHIKSQFKNRKFEQELFDKKALQAWNHFEDKDLNKPCKPTQKEIQQDLKDLNHTLDQFNHICMELKKEYLINEKIFSSLPNETLRQYTQYGSKKRFKDPIANDFYQLVRKNPSFYLEQNNRNSMGKYDADFLARSIISGQSGDPSVFIDKNGNMMEEDLKLHLHNLSKHSPYRSCDTEGPLRAMDYSLKQKQHLYQSKAQDAWNELVSKNPKAASIIGMDAIQENMFSKQKFGANFSNWLDKYCANRHSGMPFKKITKDQFEMARNQMDAFVQSEIKKLDNSLNPNDLDARNANIFATLKTRPSVMAELLSKNKSQELSANACQFIEQIYNEDTFDLRSSQIVGGAAAIAGVILMFTGVGSPLGAALLGSSVVLTTAEIGILKHNMDIANQEKSCVQGNLATSIEDDIENQLKMLPQIKSRYDDNKMGMYIAIFGLGFDAIELGALAAKLSRLKIVKNSLGTTQTINDSKSWNKLTKQAKEGLKKLNSKLKDYNQTKPQVAKRLNENIKSLNSEQMTTLSLLLRNTQAKHMDKTLEFLSNATPEGMAKILDIVANNPNTMIKTFGRLDFQKLERITTDKNILKANRVHFDQIEEAINKNFKNSTHIPLKSNNDYIDPQLGNDVRNWFKNTASTASEDIKIYNEIGTHLKNQGIAYQKNAEAFILTGDNTKLGKYAQALKKNNITVVYDPMMLKRSHIGGMYDEASSTLYIGHKSILEAKPSSAALHEATHFKRAQDYINGADDQYNLTIHSSRENIFIPSEEFIKKYSIDMKNLPYSTYFSLDEVQTYAKGVRQSLLNGKVDLKSLLNNIKYGSFSNEATIYRANSFLDSSQFYKKAPSLLKSNLTFAKKTVNGKDVFTANLKVAGKSGYKMRGSSDYTFEMILSTKEHIELAKAYQNGDLNAGIKLVESMQEKVKHLKETASKVNKNLDEIYKITKNINNESQVTKEQYDKLILLSSKNSHLTKPVDMRIKTKGISKNTTDQSLLTEKAKQLKERKLYGLVAFLNPMLLKIMIHLCIQTILILIKVILKSILKVNLKLLEECTRNILLVYF
jgi:hypothetical protein